MDLKDAYQTTNHFWPSTGNRNATNSPTCRSAYHFFLRVFTKLMKPVVGSGGMLPKSIPGWPANSTPRQGPATTDNPINQPALQEPGSDCQPEEIYSRSHSENRVSGFQNILTLSMPSEKRGKSNRMLTGCWPRHQCQWESIGKATASTQALPLALFHYRALQSLMNFVHPMSYTQEGMKNKFNTLVQLNRKANLSWWQSLDRKLLSNQQSHPWQ